MHRTDFKRGFLRAWIVLSVLWVGAVLFSNDNMRTIDNYSESSNQLQRIELGIRTIREGIEAGGLTTKSGEFRSQQEMTADLRRLENALPQYEENRRQTLGALIILVGTALVPPVFLLFLGIALGWVFAGFRRENR